MTEPVDCVVIGAGVVGLSVARALATKGREVLVLEAADLIGSGTSSRNSEVIHAGIYYDPGSLKARLCREGRDRLYAYCAERGVPHARCGKLVIAARPHQREQLQRIDDLAKANAVDDLEWLDTRALTDREPAIEGVAALHSPSTGIVDSHALMLSLQGDLEAEGGMVILRAPVVGGLASEDGIRLDVGGEELFSLTARSVVNCAGLDAQQVARSIAGLPPQHVPRRWLAKGHYYTLSGKPPFRHLIYPVPEDGGLGVHVTLDLGGQAKFGPDVRWIDEVAYEFDDTRRDAFVAAIRSYFPGLSEERLQPGYTGIRPKLSGPGEAAADFRIDGPAVHGVEGLVNLFGIESPGLTSALAIADLAAERLG